MPVFIYTSVCYLLLPFGVVAHLLFIWRRPEFRQGFWQRYGWLPNEQHRPVLVHAASVGELNAIAPLIERLLSELMLPVLVTTTSVTAQTRCQQLFGHNERVSHGFLPLDLGIANALMLRRVKPRAVLLVETELWPNLVAQCAKRKLPIVLLNGRMSARSAKAYQRFKMLVAPMLRRLSCVLVQDQASADRFIQLGANTANVKVLGSLKYDIELPQVSPQTTIDAAALESGLCWVCGSTRSGEESALLQVWSQLPPSLSGTLVLVPRHPSRFEEVADLCTQSGLAFARHSQLGEMPEAFKVAPAQQLKRVLLVDAMGLLVDYYRCADLVFVGGSLAEKGGHNPLEAAALGKPLVMGPNCFNFAQVCDQLEQVQGLMITTNASLLADVTQLLTNSDLRRRMGVAGQALVNAKKGALDRHFAVLSSILVDV